MGKEACTDNRMSAAAFLRKLCWLAALYAVLMPMARTGAEGRKRHRHRDRLPDPSLMLIPAIRHKMQRRGMIYNDSAPDYRWVVQIIDHGHYQLYCNEVVYATLVIERDPPVQYHRACHSRHLWSRDSPRILCSPALNHSNLCEQQKAYHIVRVRRRERYQETYTGCVCSASVAWTPAD